MLQIKNLTKRYKNFTAVENLSLTIREGEFLGLLGPNGAGKTTTVRMISTLTPKTSGDILFNDVSVDRNLSAVKAKIGVVPQQNNLDNELTGRENMELHGMLYSMPRKERKKRIDELLEFTGLTDRANDQTKKYSGGMKRKLMIARSMMHNPALLLLDEPTVGLDPAARRKMWDLLKRLKNRGLAILLTTHYIEEAEALCDNVAMINNGRLVEMGHPVVLIERTGKFAVDYFVAESTCSTFFEKRDEAVAYASSLTGSVNIRPSNLEDVFLQLTDRRVED